MPPSVEVRAIEALEDLQTSLVRYADQVQTTLAAVAREVQRTLDWLEARQRHWRAEVQRRREEERRAWAAYQRCQASGDERHPPSCDREAQAHADAQRRLGQAEAEERMVSQARQAVQAEADAYARDANRLRALLQTDTVKSAALLRDKVTLLRAYASDRLSAGSVLTNTATFGVGLALGTATGTSDPSPAVHPAANVGDLDERQARSLQERTLQEMHPDIQDVALDQIDLTDSPVEDESDFRKVSQDEMIAGFEKLAQVRRWISEGATDQWLYEVDQAARTQGVPEAQGHYNIYQVFYGESAITLEKTGSTYRVINGYHRLTVARQLGWTTVPARVVVP